MSVLTRSLSPLDRSPARRLPTRGQLLFRPSRTNLKMWNFFEAQAGLEASQGGERLSSSTAMWSVVYEKVHRGNSRDERLEKRAAMALAKANRSTGKKMAMDFQTQVLATVLKNKSDSFWKSDNEET